MKPEIKEKWIKALRSKEYKQGIGNLKTSVDNCTEYCCLGVLCDIAVKEKLIEWEEAIAQRDMGDVKVYKPNTSDGSFYHLPKYISDWSGLPIGNLVTIKDEKDGVAERLTFIHLNDGKRYSFDKIADIIEEQL